MFAFDDAPLPVDADLADAFRGVWDRTASAGTWWTGTERVAIASVARAAYESLETPDVDLPDAAVAAAELLGTRPAAVTREDIERWERDGLDPFHYVELIGVVSQITAVDTFHRVLGIALEPLPPPIAGSPSHTPPALIASSRKAWVPMMGPPTIPISLSAVPAEMDALEELHGAAYLAYEEMDDPAITRGLSRAQMELVASRTSAINECFY